MKQIPRVVYSHLPAIFFFSFLFFFFFFFFFFHFFLFFIFILFSFVIFSFLYFFFSFNIVVKLANPRENWYLSMSKGSGELARKNLIPSANFNGCKNDNFQLKYFDFLLKT